MKHLFYIKVPFKKAIKNGYPFHFKKVSKKGLNNQSHELEDRLYGRIPLIYSNLFYFIAGFLFSTNIAILMPPVSFNNIPYLLIFIGIAWSWLSLLQYWQETELKKWINKQLNK